VLVALVVQHAKRMRRIVLLSVITSALPHFSALFHKWHDLQGGGGIEHEIFVFVFSTTCLKRFSFLEEMSQL
jgi:hypothetical protein